MNDIARPRPRLNPRKLLLSKWTAVQPRASEKHFIVTELVAAPLAASHLPPLPPVAVVIEAVHSRRSQTIPWRELTDVANWRQGWR